jgi:signal peptidase I
VVVFHDPGGWTDADTDPTVGKAALDTLFAFGLWRAGTEDLLVKRVIGVGGDLVECRVAGGPLYVNGEVLDEPYLAEGVWPSRGEFSVRVPADSLWVMGDNRPFSADSLFQMAGVSRGFVPLRNVVGVVVVRLWPVEAFRVGRSWTGER